MIGTQATVLNSDWIFSKDPLHVKNRGLTLEQVVWLDSQIFFKSSRYAYGTVTLDWIAHNGIVTTGSSRLNT